MGAAEVGEEDEDRMKITRSGKEFTARELVEIGRLLAQMERLRAVLLWTLSGRVLVKWLDPMLTFGKAHDFYSKLRSNLEDEWFAATSADHPDPANPFYSEIFQREAHTFEGRLIDLTTVADVRARLTRTVEEQTIQDARDATEAQ